MKITQEDQKQVGNQQEKQSTSTVPGCWPLFLIPFACIGTFLVIQGFNILSYRWSHPTISSYAGGYHQVGRSSYPLPPSLPADTHTLQVANDSLLFSGIIYGTFALVLTLVWLLIFSTVLSRLRKSFSSPSSQPVPEEATDAALESQHIRFTWREQQYEADLAVYEQEQNILLPDGTLLRPESGWLETWPLTPNGLVVVPYDQQDEELVVRAKRLGACIARESAS